MMRSGHPYFAGAPLLIAHRGGAGLAPENTLEAFETALSRWRADIVEIDVRPTLDGTVVVFHDADLDRTTDGSGAVVEHTLEEIRALDAGHRFSLDGGRTFPFRGRGVRVPTLEEVLRRFPDARFNIEIKDARAQDETRDVVSRCDAWHRVLIAAESRGDRTAFRGAAVPRSASRHQLWMAVLAVRLRLQRLAMPRVDALQLPHRHLRLRPVTPRLVRAAHARNMAVHVWTVNDEALMRSLLRMGVDGIVTDRPDRLARVLHLDAGRPPPPGAGRGAVAA